LTKFKFTQNLDTIFWLCYYYNSLSSFTPPQKGGRYVLFSVSSTSCVTSGRCVQWPKNRRQSVGWSSSADRRRTGQSESRKRGLEPLADSSRPKDSDTDVQTSGKGGNMIEKSLGERSPRRKEGKWFCPKFAFGRTRVCIAQLVFPFLIQKMKAKFKSPPIKFSIFYKKSILLEFSIESVA